MHELLEIGFGFRVRDRTERVDDDECRMNLVHLGQNAMLDVCGHASPASRRAKILPDQHAHKLDERREHGDDRGLHGGGVRLLRRIGEFTPRFRAHA